jgi:hypothetical protein
LINGKSIKGPGNLRQKISFIEVANSVQELFAIVTASIRNKSKEVLAISHEVTIGDREITLSPRLENRILLGDLPEAHEIEIHPDSKAKNLRPSPLHPSL